MDIVSEIQVCVDLRYQRIDKYVKNISIPDKEPRKATLTVEQKLENTKKSRKRVFVEHVNRFCKILGLLKKFIVVNNKISVKLGVLSQD